MSISVTSLAQTKKVSKFEEPPSVAADTARIPVTDSTRLTRDSLAVVDSLNADYADSDVKSKINYEAQDSIVYDLTSKKMYLYNKTKMAYDKTKLNADHTEFDWNTFTLTAEGQKDSAGNETGTPEFSDNDQPYRARKMAYNFKTKQGKVYEVSTKEGEAYLHSVAVKRNEDESWFGYKTKYTTCDLDHPHFYFQAKRAKVVPNKVMVTGPVNLWIADVPTPLYLPFAMFPIKQGRRSGAIIPKYGEAAGTFFLRDGGYYWAVNDMLGIKLTGDIFLNGTFGAHIAANYRVNYKVSGNVGFDYIRTRPADPDLPRQRSTNSFNFTWQLALDPKARPTNSFNVNVNVNLGDYYQAARSTDNSIFQTAFNSNISYAKSFPRAPFLSLAINAAHNQNIATKTFSITFPTVRFAITSVAPFKSKFSSGAQKWYERILVNYALDFKNQLNTFDSLLNKPETYKNMNYGINQTANISAPFTLFKYLNISPSFTYNERWFFKSVEHGWVNKDQILQLPNGTTVILPGASSYLQTDTIYKFRAMRDFSASIQFSTKLTGIFNFKGKLLKALRHTFTPAMSVQYNPNFSKPFWNYYQRVRTDLNGNTALYNRFDINAPLGYGSAPSVQSASLNWSLGNSFDLKTFSKSDSVKHEKTINNFLRVNITGGYNFAADSLRLQPFNISGGIQFLQNINANFNVQLDPYAVDKRNVRINQFYWNTNHKLLRFTNATFSITASFRGKAKATAATNEVSKLPKMIADYVVYNPDVYYNFAIPWSIAPNYSILLNSTKSAFTQQDTIIFTQTLNVSGDVNITPKWKVSARTGYDFQQKDLTITQLTVIRDLHCWELSFNYTAYPLRYQQFVIDLHIRSSTLKDLKLTKKSDPQIIQRF
ncbi:MAG: putative LPS assembly protein LptD [Chitinophagales bacterium]